MPRSGLSGDFGILAAWERAFRDAPKALDEMARPMAEQVLDLIQDGFASESNPYGEPWAPKAIPDGRSVLVGKTARLRRGWRVKRSSKSGFLVAPSVDYAGLHQNPTKRRIKAKGKKALRIQAGSGILFRRSAKPPPQRLMIPTSSRGIPSSWGDAMAEVALDVIRGRIQPKRRRDPKRLPGSSGGSPSSRGVRIRGFNSIAILKRIAREISG